MADFDGTRKIVRRGVAVIIHLVVGMKSGDVPGNVRRDASKKFREAPKFVVGIVEARNEQRHDLEPQSHAVNTSDGIEDRSDTPTQFVIVAIVEALEIDFIQIEPGTQVFEHLGSTVAVRNKSGQESCGLRFFEDCDRPFAGDQRLVIRADQHSWRPDGQRHEPELQATLRSGGDTALGSRKACDVTQFWQYPQCRSHPNMPKL